MRRHVWRLAATVLIMCGIQVSRAHAQLNTQHLKGTVGLKAGTQAPPHWYAVLPLLFVYNADKVKTRDGDTLPIDASLTSTAFGVGVARVTSMKLLGGNYGFQVLFPVGANNRLQGTEIDADPGAGLTDSVVQPISLGWHFERADALAGYTIFVPTGRYTRGASDNTGLGMWGHELTFGTTVFLNSARTYHAATQVSFDFQSKKEDSETKVGNTMILEGGAGADFLNGGLTAGLAYYAALKLTEDRFDGLPVAFIIPSKNRVFALGPEVSLALARNNVVYGFLKVNYQWELYARTTTQGSEFNIVATFPLPPIPVPGP